MDDEALQRLAEAERRICQLWGATLYLQQNCKMKPSNRLLTGAVNRVIVSSPALIVAKPNLHLALKMTPAFGPGVSIKPQLNVALSMTAKTGGQASGFVGTAVNDTGGGSIAWSNPTNIIGTPTGIYSDASFSGGTATTNYLIGTNFGLTVPVGATVKGITVITRQANPNSMALLTAFTQLFSGGLLIGTQKNSTGPWSGGFSSHTWGSASDLWGATLTPAVVNSSGFGVAFSSSDVGDTGDFRVESIQVEVQWSM